MTDRKFLDLTGLTYGAWTVVKQASKSDSRDPWYWTCRCVCGTVRDVRSSNLINHWSRSCGCQRVVHKPRPPMSRTQAFYQHIADNWEWGT